MAGGATNIFAGASTQNYFSYGVSNGAHVGARGIWYDGGGTELAAAAVRVDPSELVRAVYTQTVQWSRWLNSRWL